MAFSLQGRYPVFKINISPEFRKGIFPTVMVILCLVSFVAQTSGDVLCGDDRLRVCMKHGLRRDHDVKNDLSEKKVW